MNKKAIIFDVDGVIIRGELFGAYFQREHSIAAAEMLPFYTGVFQDCLTDKVDLKEVLIQNFLLSKHISLNLLKQNSKIDTS